MLKHIGYVPLSGKCMKIYKDCWNVEWRNKPSELASIIHITCQSSLRYYTDYIIQSKQQSPVETRACKLTSKHTRLAQRPWLHQLPVQSLILLLLITSSIFFYKNTWFLRDYHLHVINLNTIHDSNLTQLLLSSI